MFGAIDAGRIQITLLWPEIMHEAVVDVHSQFL
jgi:hypothetical protein